MRTCPKCGETKPTSAFSRSSSTKHGFQSRCKECKKAEARSGYANNIAHHREYHRDKQSVRRSSGIGYVTVTCKNCGKPWKKRNDSLRGWSGECRSCVGKRVTADPGIRQMLADKARKQIEEWGGQIPVRNRRILRGADHWNWKGGITDASKLERTTGRYAAWRKAVFARDNYTCQECGQRGYKLNAHHIKSWADYPDLRFELSNGVTLCEDCHERVHAKEAGERLGKARDRAYALRTKR